MRAAELPSLRHLRMFEAVARLESLSRAAVEVNRSQPAVTQALANLEELLGVAVFERRHSGSYLTEPGRILLLRTQRLVAQFTDALLAPLVGMPLVEGTRLRPTLCKITSNHVRGLIGTAEGGAIDRAARQIGVSPASLIRTLRDLEQILARRITHHTAHGVALTPTGIELARRFKLAMREIEYACEEIDAARGGALTTVSIGAIPQSATSVLAAAIEDFLGRKPGAQVKVSDGPYDALLNDLRTGQIDFLFGVLRRPAWATDVEEEALFTDPYVIVVRKDHPLKRSRSIRLDDFAGYDWILPRPGTPRRVAFEHLFDGARRKPASSVETSALDVQVTLIAASDRMTLMSRQEARRAETGGLVSALDFRPQVARGCDGVTMRSGWHPTAGNLLFLQILREQARAISETAVLRRPAARARGARRSSPEPLVPQPLVVA